MFTWIDKISEDNELIKTPNEVKRRLFEMMVHSCTSDVRDAGTVGYISCIHSFKLY